MLKMKNTRIIRSYHLLGIVYFCLLITSCESKESDQLRCGTMDSYKERLDSDPEFAQNQAKLEETISEYVKRIHTDDITQFRTGKIVIPVVVHVIYKNAAENISDAQIQSQISVLNEDFRRLNPDVSGVPPEFASFVADVRIEFKLAARDPDCNPTTGITRTSTTVPFFTFSPLAATPMARNPVKFSSSGGQDGWPSDKYLNLWVCGDIAPWYYGYASWPSDLALRPDEDGVVIDFNAFGTTGTVIAPNNQGRILVHEIGHWLNLKHIWGDDQSETDNCSVTDNVGDTPNQDIYNIDCPEHPHESCGSNDMFMNYMDVVDNDCMIMFTNGQSDRMDAVLYTTRTDIVSSQGDVPPPAETEDLFSRDMMDDVGDEPNTTSSHMYRSDDIWVRNSNDGIINQEHQNPVGGSSNFVYVRVRNRGCGTASSSDVKLYWAKASSGLSWPEPWDGSVTAPALMGNFISQKPTGSVVSSGFVILEYKWNTPDPADYSSFGADKVHFCLLSRIESSSTTPFGMTFSETTNLGENVRNNNNIVWKNVTVAQRTRGRSFASGLISNYTENSGKYDIVFEVANGEKSLFENGDVSVYLSHDLFQSWEEGGKEGELVELGDSMEVNLLKSGAMLKNISIKSMKSYVIEVRFVPDHKQMKYERNIFQLEMLQYVDDGNEFIGGQTFTFRVGI